MYSEQFFGVFEEVKIEKGEKTCLQIYIFIRLYLRNFGKEILIQC